MPATKPFAAYSAYHIAEKTPRLRRRAVYSVNTFDHTLPFTRPHGDDGAYKDELAADRVGRQLSPAAGLRQAWAGDSRDFPVLAAGGRRPRAGGDGIQRAVAEDPRRVDVEKIPAKQRPLHLRRARGACQPGCTP
jgi:hypothetical protein